MWTEWNKFPFLKTDRTGDMPWYEESRVTLNVINGTQPKYGSDTSPKNLVNERLTQIKGQARHD
jgi:hypothetical protein